MVDIEFQRIVLSSYSEELKKRGILNRVILVDEGYILQVDVEGPFEQTADFRLESKFGYVNNTASLTGLYTSELLPEGNIASWTIKANSDISEVCSLLIMDFVEDCIYKEHEKVIETELVTDRNIEEYAQFLNDEALTNPEIFAVGYRVNDVDGPVPAGAASFYYTEENLVIDNIEVVPEYQDMGIEDYITKYIIKNALEA